VDGSVDWAGAASPTAHEKPAVRGGNAPPAGGQKNANTAPSSAT